MNKRTLNVYEVIGMAIGLATYSVTQRYATHIVAMGHIFLTIYGIHKARTLRKEIDGAHQGILDAYVNIGEELELFKKLQAKSTLRDIGGRGLNELKVEDIDPKYQEEFIRAKANAEKRGHSLYQSLHTYRPGGLSSGQAGSAAE